MRGALSLFILAFMISGVLEAGAPRIKKVLSHFLDQEDQHALSPSLYERDAYQAELRENPEMVSTVRFDIRWAASKYRKSDLTLKLEVRGSKKIETVTLEQKVRARRWIAKWTSITLEKELYQEQGKVLAWRVSLWEGKTQLAEQSSFLW